MLTVKNTSPKVIGFGVERILPDEIKTLPKQYSENHPVVKFYIERGWLAKSSDGGVLVSPNVKLEDEDDAGQKHLSKRALGRMKQEELAELAAGRGIEIPDNPTKDILIGLILALDEAEGSGEQPDGSGTGE